MQSGQQSIQADGLRPPPNLSIDVRVRPAVPTDSGHFARIGAATFALACPPSTPPKDLEAYIATELSAARFEQDIACGTKSLFSAEAAEEVVGYMMLCREGAPQAVRAENPLELRRLYAMPQHHGRGVAASLLAEAITEAIRHANDALWLTVSVENHRAINFYRKHGFSAVGEQQFKVGSDIHRDLVMSRSL